MDSLYGVIDSSTEGDHFIERLDRTLAGRRAHGFQLLISTLQFSTAPFWYPEVLLFLPCVVNAVI